MMRSNRMTFPSCISEIRKKQLESGSEVKMCPDYPRCPVEQSGLPADKGGPAR